MNIDFDDDAHRFSVDTPFWKTTIAFGDTHAFIVNADLNDAQIKTLETLVAASALFGNNITSASILFEATAVAFVAQKDMPVPSAGALTQAFEFGFIQGIQQSDLHCEYWGKSATDGRSILHTTLSNRFEVDTTDTAKPFTKLPGRRATVTQAQPGKPGFHAFRINARHQDHPQFQINRFHFVRGPRDILPRRLLLRSVSCQLDFVTIFSLLDKTTAKFSAISATRWRVKWNHIVTYKERFNPGGASDFLPTVIGPDRDLLPSGGNPSLVDSDARDVIAKAQAGAPFLTPEVLNARLTASTGRTLTDEDKNDDFDPSFITPA